MFRLQENTPEIYIKESRDFQLFLRLYDLVNNSVRYSIKSIDNILNPYKCSDRLLPLLCTRVGFFPKADYNSYALREIISVFSNIIKNKGSKQGIQIALNAILKAEKNYYIDENDRVKIYISSEDSKISIYTKKPIINQTLLEDVLDYVLPIGFILEIGEYSEEKIYSTGIYATDIVKNAKVVTLEYSSVVDIDESNENLEEAFPNYYKGNYTATEVVNIDEIGV